MLYAQSKPGVFVGILVILIVSLFLDKLFYSPLYIFATIGVLISQVLTYAILIRFGNTEKTEYSASYRGNLMAIFNFMTGLAWGLFFSIGTYNPNEVHIFISLFFIVAISIGSTPVLSYYLPSYIAFSIALITPLTVSLLLSKSDLYIMLGSILPTILIVGYSYAYYLNKTNTSSFRLRYEKEELIRQLEQQKEIAEKSRMEAEDSNLAKSRILAVASHDLRQPLHALSLFTETLKLQIHDKKQQTIVSYIGQSVLAMENLFNALLDISKLDAGVIPVKAEIFNLDTVINRLYCEFRSLHNEGNVDFEYIKTDVVLNTDPALLETILRNIVSNAFRYTANGRIWMKCHSSNSDFATLEIGDTGIGIPETALDNIFEEYYRVDSTSRKFNGGLGLGLAIVKRLANILGLEISVISKVHVGTQFLIKIPEIHIDPNDIVYRDIETPRKYVRNTKPNLDILVIDDDELVREGISALLSKWGYRHHVFESTIQAITLIKCENYSPGAIIADYQLGTGETGIEAIEKIHSLLGSDIPSIIITGDILIDHLIVLRTSDIPVMHKPIKPAELRKFLRNCERMTETDNFTFDAI